VYAKHYYDAHHHPLVFNVDDWVWLRLLNHHMRSLDPGTRGKLGPRYAGPFQITKHVGEVAYCLRLPLGARIHDVFHVGVLKPFHGTPPATTPALPPIQHGRLLQQPEKIIKSQLCRGTWHVLVQWSGLPPSEATWEPILDFKTSYPEFQLEDKLFPEEGRDVMVDHV